MAVLLLFMPLVLRLFRGSDRAALVKGYQQVTAIAAAAAGLLTLVQCLPFLFRWQHQGWQRYPAAWTVNLWAGLAALVALQRVGVALSWTKTPNQWTKLLVNTLLKVSGPLLALVLFLVVGHWFLIAEPINERAAIHWNGDPMLWWLTGILLVYSWLLLDINQSSLHPFYRDRLSSTYVVQAMPANQRMSDQLQPQGRKRLTELREHNPAVPYHLINTAQLERLDPHLDLATAMAISGAAASPFMGTKTTPARLVLAALNIRLDYWLPLPGRWRIPIVGRMPGPWYLLRQAITS